VFIKAAYTFTKVGLHSFDTFRILVCKYAVEVYMSKSFPVCCY